MNAIGRKYNAERYRSGVTPEINNSIFQRNIDRLMQAVSDLDVRSGSLEKKVGGIENNTTYQVIANNKDESEERSLMMGL